MIPLDLQKCLQKVMNIKFDQEPPYEYILDCLQICFEKSLRACMPQAPPSNTSSTSNANWQAAHLSAHGNGYLFEWDRSPDAIKCIRNKRELSLAAATFHQ